MPTAQIITHVAFEDAGSLQPELLRAGFYLQAIDACTADWRHLDPLSAELVVVLGGPVGVYETAAYPFIAAERDWLAARLAARRTTLGICLGAQLIAAALGARVYPGTRGKEIGWSALQPGAQAAAHPRFAPLCGGDLQVLHWHGDTFDLPPGAQHLAATARYAHQGFAIDDYVLALQFHPEVTAQGLERWYVGHAAELGQAGIDVAQLRRDSQRLAPLLETGVQPFWRRWLDELSVPARVTASKEVA
ncbi:MAG: glutamine amidotransferase [Steroidobacteraceae bacterium]